MKVIVKAPQESGRIPYLSQDTLRQLAAVTERLKGLHEAGQLADDPLAPKAPTAADRSGPALEEMGWLPDSVRRGYRTREEYQRLKLELHEAAIAAWRGDAGTFREQLGADPKQAVAQLLSEAGLHLPNGRTVKLSEAMGITEFPVLLRSGLRTILFDSFAGTPTTYQDLAQVVGSDKSEEYWVEMSRLGLFGRVDENEAYPEVGVTMLPSKVVRNAKYGGVIRITEEMVKFDRTNQIMQIPRDRGQAAAMTIENQFYTVLTNTALYTKTSADNNVGNNTATSTFTPQNLITAYETLVTMKEGRSGRYLGIMPDTLVCGTGVYYPAVQLLKSAQIQSGVTTTGAVGGVGQTNPLLGLLPNVVQSPYMGRYGWAIGAQKKGLIYQEVEPLTLADQATRDGASPEWMRSDVWLYKARVWFGVGLFDDRYWFYSNSSTVPNW